MAEDQVEFNCPHCNQLYKLTTTQLQRYAGRSTNCRKCQQPFQFPSAAEPEPDREEAAVEEQVVEEEPEQEAAAAESPAQQEPAQYAAPQYPTPFPPQPAASRQTLQYQRPPASRRVEPFSMGAFLGFRYLAAPMLIHVVFWFGVAVFVYSGMVTISQTMQFASAVGVNSFMMWGLAAGLSQLILGPVMVRIFCEVVLVLFRILDSLRDIKDAVDDRLPRS